MDPLLCGLFPSTPSLCLLQSSDSPISSCGNQTLPNVPWEAKSAQLRTSGLKHESSPLLHPGQLLCQGHPQDAPEQRLASWWLRSKTKHVLPETIGERTGRTQKFVFTEWKSLQKFKKQCLISTGWHALFSLVCPRRLQGRPHPRSLSSWLRCFWWNLHMVTLLRAPW